MNLSQTTDKKLSTANETILRVVFKFQLYRVCF